MGMGMLWAMVWCRHGMEHIGKGFWLRLCDSMLLTAYRDISRSQAHDGLWVTVVNAHGSRTTGHLSWIMEYGVRKIGVCVGPRAAFANGELWLG